MKEGHEDSFDLILDILDNILEGVDDLEELRQLGMFIGNIFDMREGLLEARRNAEEALTASAFGKPRKGGKDE
jgi:hypothetical protein